MSLLEIKDLNISYKTRKETIVASSNVNFTLERGEILGIVGESGSGKSTIIRMHKHRVVVGYPRIPFSLEFRMPPFFLGMNSVRAFASLTASVFAHRWYLYRHVCIAQGTRHILFCESSLPEIMVDASQKI